jgi:hypothetical protein
MLSASIIALMMAASTSETPVNLYQTTWRNNPEDSHLHTRHHENLKSHVFYGSSVSHVAISDFISIPLS